MDQGQLPFCLEEAGKEDQQACLGVHATKGWYKCWRCGTKGRLDGFEDVLDEEPVEEGAEPIELPEGFTLLADAWGAIVAEEPVEYLRSRQVDRAMCEELEIGACFSGYYAERVVVPLRSLKGALLNWVARSWNKQEPKRYRYAPKGKRVLFNERALYIETAQPLLLVEGVFDAFPYYPNAAAFGGKPTDEQVALLMDARRPLVVALDGDAWQESEALAMYLMLGGQRADWLKLPPGRDPADKKVDPDELWQQAVALFE